MNIKIDKRNDEVVYSFDKIPTEDIDLTNIEEYLKEPTFAPAFFILTMCGYETNKDFCFKVLDILNGPRDVNNYDKSFYSDRFMDGKFYKPYSYFEGATPDNNYKPNIPYVVHVYDDPNGTKEEGYKSFLMQSSGADAKRKVTVRLKPSINSWFLTDEMLLGDIRIPKKDDEWA